MLRITQLTRQQLEMKSIRFPLIYTQFYLMSDNNVTNVRIERNVHSAH